MSKICYTDALQLSKCDIRPSRAASASRENPENITKVRTTPLQDAQHTPAPTLARNKTTSLSVRFVKNAVKDVKKDLKKQQQQQTIREQIVSLFGIHLSQKRIQTLLRTAQENGVELEQMIENTHAYHTQVDTCRNIFGAIKYGMQLSMVAG